MTTDDNVGGTQRIGVTQLPVRSLRVDVLTGPDAGQSHTSGAEVVSVGTAAGNDVVLTDQTVSGYHLELKGTDKGIEVTDHRSTNGTAAGGIGLRSGLVPGGTVLTLGHTTLRVSEGSEVMVDLHPASQLGEMVGRSAAMRRLMAQLERSASSEVPILVTGESGCGKQLVAEAVHALSARQAQPFVVVDCGALTPSLVASELFGHEKGAFTGAATRHAGAFERAKGGTLLLDEIGDLPIALQPSLLGVLERRRFSRVGGTEELESRARVVGATNRDLQARVNAGSFRLDLYFRLAVVNLRVPALRDHPEDIPLLVGHFLRQSGFTDPVESIFAAADMEKLQAYAWPGNVRELRNVVEARLVMGEYAPDTFDSQENPGDEEEAQEGAADGLSRYLDLPFKEARGAVSRDFESRYLTRLWRHASGNLARAARKAQLDRSYLRDLLRRHGLK